MPFIYKKATIKEVKEALKKHYHSCTIVNLKNEIDDEKNNLNRKTVIELFKRAIRRKKKYMKVYRLHDDIYSKPLIYASMDELIDHIKMSLDWLHVGESPSEFKVEMLEMTDKQFAALPEIDE